MGKYFLWIVMDCIHMHLTFSEHGYESWLLIIWKAGPYQTSFESPIPTYRNHGFAVWRMPALIELSTFLFILTNGSILTLEGCNMSFYRLRSKADNTFGHVPPSVHSSRNIRDQRAARSSRGLLIFNQLNLLRHILPITS